MVAGKMRAAMGLNKTPSPARSATTKPSPQPPPPPPQPPSSSGKSAHLSKSQVFSRSFGVYFPRSSAQVQPKPPDVAELLRLVEELRDRESILKTEILSCKLLKESAAIVPAMEKELFEKEAEIARAYVRVESLEKENAELRREREEREGQVEAMEKRMREIEEEIAEMKKTEKRFQGLMEVSVRSNLIKNLKKNLKSNESSSTSTNQQKLERSDSKREEEVETHAPPLSNITEEFTLSTSLRSRIPRVPKPPPRPSSSSASSNGDNKALLASIPPPPPPPPPMSKVKVAPPPPPPPMPKGRKAATEKVKRVPEVVEFYHSLMRRDSRRDSGGGGPDAPATANARDMIGEIENRSAYLLAIKTDVETQGEFIRLLIKEVENAAFTDINDVVPFVKWLDDELSYLVDERAVLKHFDWPEQKADALREAAFGYCDLKKLQTEASSFPDHSRQPIGSTLKKMQALLEKLEHGVYNLSRMRESATKRYKVFQIPTNWMLDTEFVSQIKLASIKLATKYMKRVSAELELVGGGGPEEEELIVQGVRFAFRVHQFAGGFDAETMRAFQVLRDKVRSCHVQCQNQQQQQKIICKSTPC